MPIDFDGLFEEIHVLVLGNFDCESVLIVISQDPAINAEGRVRHSWRLGVGTDAPRQAPMTRPRRLPTPSSSLTTSTHTASVPSCFVQHIYIHCTTL